MKLKIPFIILFIFFSCFSVANHFDNQQHNHQYNPKLNNAELFILTNKPDSAQFILDEIHDTTYNTYTHFLKTYILTKHTSYKHLNTFALTIHNRREIPPHFFLNYSKLQSIPIPNSSDTINLDYVNLIGNHINILADNGFLEEAERLYKIFKHYIHQFNTESDYKDIAIFKINSYNALLEYINDNFMEAKILHQENIELGKKYAKQHEYRWLIEAYSSYLPVLQRIGDLNGYIEICREIIKLEILEHENFTQPSSSSTPTFSLLDALIYKNTKFQDTIEDLEEIKKLLHSMLHKPSLGVRVMAYRHFVQFFKIIDENSQDAKDIYKQLEVENLIELCRFTVDQAEKHVSKLEMISILNDLTVTLKIKGYYKEALMYSIKSNRLIKTQYQDDLSEQLANFKTLNAESKRISAENSLKSKTKLDRYIFISLSIIILFILLIVRSQIIKNKILRKSEFEKKLFIKEINHRIKNNLQLASSYLKLQFKPFKSEDINFLIQDWHSKVKSIITVHEFLYKNDLLEVHLNQYTHDVIEQTLSIYSDIQTKIDINIPNSYYINSNSAVKIGLILNELTTNSVKHTLSDDKTLSIKLECTQLSHHYQLKYSDFGKNMEHEIHYAMKTSFGFKLIHNLCMQLEGQFSYSQQDNLFIITFSK